RGETSAGRGAGARCVDRPPARHRRAVQRCPGRVLARDCGGRARCGGRERARSARNRRRPGAPWCCGGGVRELRRLGHRYDRVVSTRFREFALPLAGILLLAINLRPAITAVGPIITEVGEDLSLSSSELGLLGALPIATFGAVSAFVQIFIQRFGVERVTVAAMLVLTGATVLRSWPGPDANLWIGTVLIGAAIAVGNVAVPVFVKRSFPDRTATITSIYVAVLGVCAGLAAALSVPIANASRLGWRLSLGVWAALTVLAVVYWAGQAIQARPVSGGSS